MLIRKTPPVLSKLIPGARRVAANGNVTVNRILTNAKTKETKGEKTDTKVLEPEASDGNI
jgi:hypothetical protein